MNESDLISKGFIKSSTGQWFKANRIGVGQLQSQEPQPKARPLERASSGKKKSRLGVARGHCLIRVCILSFRHRLLDSDNYQGGTKPLRDAIAAWLGLDDKDSVIEWEYSQVLTRGAQGTAVRIEQIL